MTTAPGRVAQEEGPHPIRAIGAYGCNLLPGFPSPALRSPSGPILKLTPGMKTRSKKPFRIARKSLVPNGIDEDERMGREQPIGMGRDRGPVGRLRYDTGIRSSALMTGSKDSSIEVAIIDLDGRANCKVVTTSLCSAAPKLAATGFRVKDENAHWTLAFQYETFPVNVAQREQFRAQPRKTDSIGASPSAIDRCSRPAGPFDQLSQAGRPEKPRRAQIPGRWFRADEATAASQAEACEEGRPAQAKARCLGPGSGSPDGTSCGGVSSGVGGRITSGSGTGMGSMGSGVGMFPSLLRGNARECAFCSA